MPGHTRQQRPWLRTQALCNDDDASLTLEANSPADAIEQVSQLVENACASVGSFNVQTSNAETAAQASVFPLRLLKHLFLR